jgi:putative CocE/NonD family hydrolase
MQRLPTLLRMMRRRTRKGPPARYDVTWEPGLTVPAADGTPLRADHYAPVTDERCPTVLIRSPYGHGFPWNYLYGALFAEQGFHVVLASTRAYVTFGRHEVDDGLAVVAWLREQEWFTGSFSTIGPSYLAYTQWALGLDPPPEWRAAVLQVPAHAPGFWQDGAFRLELALVGGMGLFSQSQGLWGYSRAILRLQRHLRYVLRAVPLIDVYPRAFGGPRPAFEDWLTHPDADDAYWTGSDLGSAADGLAVPVSLATGWWDLTLDQTLQQYARLRAAGRDPDLLIGPWTHTSALDKGWPELFAQALRRLCGGEPARPVRVHLGGADEWLEFPRWPPPGATETRLHFGAGTLGSEPGAGSTTFRYDPGDPTPSIGGQLQSRTQGPRDNAKLERRKDVLTFTTEPLSAAVDVLGPVRAEVDVDFTAAGADLFVRLCDVAATGKSVNVTDGLLRLRQGGRAVVEMSHTAHRFRPGHRIRLQVSGGAHPRWARNYGTGEPLATAVRMVANDTTVRHTSALVLSVV